MTALTRADQRRTQWLTFGAAAATVLVVGAVLGGPTAIACADDPHGLLDCLRGKVSHHFHLRTWPSVGTLPTATPLAPAPFQSPVEAMIAQTGAEVMPAPSQEADVAGIDLAMGGPELVPPAVPEAATAVAGAPPAATVAASDKPPVGGVAILGDAAEAAESPAPVEPASVAEPLIAPPLPPVTGVDAVDARPAERSPVDPAPVSVATATQPTLPAPEAPPVAFRLADAVPADATTPVETPAAEPAGTVLAVDRVTALEPDAAGGQPVLASPANPIAPTGILGEVTVPVTMPVDAFGTWSVPSRIVALTESEATTAAEAVTAAPESGERIAFLDAVLPSISPDEQAKTPADPPLYPAVPAAIAPSSAEPLLPPGLASTDQVVTAPIAAGELAPSGPAMPPSATAPAAVPAEPVLPAQLVPASGPLTAGIQLPEGMPGAPSPQISRPAQMTAAPAAPVASAEPVVAARLDPVPDPIIAGIEQPEVFPAAQPPVAAEATAALDRPPAPPELVVPEIGPLPSRVPRDTRSSASVTTLGASSESFATLPGYASGRKNGSVLTLRAPSRNVLTLPAAGGTSPDVQVLGK